MGAINWVGSLRLACCPHKTSTVTVLGGHGTCSLRSLGGPSGVHRHCRRSTCSSVSFLSCVTCDFATMRVPLTKSHPMGCVHSGGAFSVPRSVTARGCNPTSCHVASFWPRAALLPWNACTTGGRLYPSATSLLWNSLSPGRQIMGNSAGSTAMGESAPCSKMGRAHVRNGGVRSAYSGRK